MSDWDGHTERRVSPDYTALMAHVSDLNVKCERLDQSIQDFGKMVERQSVNNDSIAALTHEQHARVCVLENVLASVVKANEEFRAWVEEHKKRHFPDWDTIALYVGIVAGAFGLFEIILKVWRSV